MAQGMQRQWPAAPQPTPESLVLWAQQITRLLQEGAIPSGDAIASGFQPLDPELTALAGLASAANKLPYFTGAAAAALADFTAFGRTLVDDANAAAARATIGAVNIAGDTMTGVLTVPAGFLVQKQGGAEGGEMYLEGPASGTSISGNVVFDVASNQLRFFELGGTNRGTNIDLTACAGGAGTSLLPTVVAAQATTSGTAFDFTGLPASVSRIIINFNGVSLSGTNQILVQIGDSGGIETTGYASASHDFTTGNSSTAGFIIRTALAADGVSGAMVLIKLDTNTWTSLHGITRAATTNASSSGGGSKTLSAGPLDRVRILASGADTFDAGSVNIVYD